MYNVGQMKYEENKSHLHTGSVGGYQPLVLLTSRVLMGRSVEVRVGTLNVGTMVMEKSWPI